MSFYCGFFVLEVQTSGKLLFCYLGMSASHSGPNQEEQGVLKTQREHLHKHFRKITKRYR